MPTTTFPVESAAEMPDIPISVRDQGSVRIFGWMRCPSLPQRRSPQQLNFIQKLFIPLKKIENSTISPSATMTELVFFIDLKVPLKVFS